MKKILLIALSGFIWLLPMRKKMVALKGIVFDTIAKQPVAAATITVLQRSDSSLVTFTMTNNRGEFSSPMFLMAIIVYSLHMSIIITSINFLP